MGLPQAILKNDNCLVRIICGGSLNIIVLYNLMNKNIIDLWLFWIAIAGVMYLGHFLMDGYKPLTAYALLGFASGIVAAVTVTIVSFRNRG